MPRELAWVDPEMVRLDVHESIGVARRSLGAYATGDDVDAVAERDQMIDYVLDRFSPDETTRLTTVLPRAADAVVALVRGGLDSAMAEYNRAPDD